MATTVAKSQISRRKKFVFTIVVSSFTTICLLSLGEMIARSRVGPWTIQEPIVSIEPAGRTYFVAHPTLGYLPRPGEVKVTLPGPYSFSITHANNGLRITHPLDTYPATGKQEVWIFGCSLTEGWTLNDAETYPWLLQEKFADYEVVNFGISGYSTVQSLIQLREALKNGHRPGLVILAYAAIHDQRNTLTRYWMKTRMTSGGARYLKDVSLPYVRQSGEKTTEILYEPLRYREFPLAHYSALANLIDDTYNQFLEKTYHSHEVSKVLIEELSNLCKTNQITFVVAGLGFDPATSEMLEYCGSRGIPTVNISVDLLIKENTNLPFDNHPSALANRRYAQKLAEFLCANKLVNESSCLR